MGTNINNLTITSIETITAFDIRTGNFKFVLDELQDATIAQTQDEAEITGKGGRRINTIKRNKAVTISGTNGFMSTGLMEMQTGVTFENGVAEIKWVDHLTVNSHTATTAYKAVGTTGKEITALYIKDGSDNVQETLTQAASTGAGKFTYAPASKLLTFDNAVADGTEIVVYYNRKVEADTLTNSSDKYSDKCVLYVDAIGEDKCANLYHVQFYIPKADFSGEFNLEMGGDQSVHAFEANALAGACGTSGEFYKCIIFGQNAADAT